MRGRGLFETCSEIRAEKERKRCLSSGRFEVKSNAEVKFLESFKPQKRLIDFKLILCIHFLRGLVEEVDPRNSSEISRLLFIHNDPRR